MSLSDPSNGSISFPSIFEIRKIETNGATIHTRVGGQGPAVVLLHGFGTTGDMWVPLASVLAAEHTVVVPDLRGLGLSSKPTGGYDKKTQSLDVASVMQALGVFRADFVTHDIGNMVGYAFAVGFPDRVTRFVPIDAPLPGVGPWEQVVQDPRMWQFGFGGPDMERLVAGRERIYLDRFWNEFSLHPERFDEAKRQHYAARSTPCPARFGRASHSSLPSDKTDSIARPILPRASLQCPCLRLEAKLRSVR
jgi:pimeloyl-ACP methyl ester carboxylesterase